MGKHRHVPENDGTRNHISPNIVTSNDVDAFRELPEDERIRLFAILLAAAANYKVVVTEFTAMFAVLAFLFAWQKDVSYPWDTNYLESYSWIIYIIVGAGLLTTVHAIVKKLGESHGYENRARIYEKYLTSADKDPIP